MIAAAPAFAADAIYDPAPLPSVETVDPARWDGFYAGIQLGGAFDPNTGVLALSANPSPPPFAAFGSNYYGSFDSGFTGGVHAGYDWQFGNFVIGGIADISAIDAEEVQGADSSTPAFYREVRSLDYYGTLRGRLGATLFDRGLFYAHGGLAYGQVDYRFSSNTPATVTTAGGNDGHFGYVVGTGMEALLTDHISFGVEYQYVNLGDSDFTTTLSGGPFGAGVDARGTEDDFDFHVVQMKLSYRF